MSIVSTLERGELGKLEDWHRLFPGFASEASIWRRVSELPLPPNVLLWWRDHDRSLEWARVRDVVNRWLDEAHVRPQLFIAFRERRSVTLGGNGLLGALAVQLLYAICRSQGLETCSACGATFAPRRRPARGRRRYCPACHDGGAPARDATRAHHRRRAEAYRLHLRGTPPEAIARALDTNVDRVRAWIRKEARSARQARKASRRQSPRRSGLPRGDKQGRDQAPV